MPARLSGVGCIVLAVHLERQVSKAPEVNCERLPEVHLVKRWNGGYSPPQMRFTASGPSIHGAKGADVISQQELQRPTASAATHGDDSSYEKVCHETIEPPVLALNLRGETVGHLGGNHGQRIPVA
jgi:hypothetical protein